MPKYVDTNRNVTAYLPRLKAAGVLGIGRYIDSGAPGNEKHIKPAEARAIAAHGMKLFLIYENNGKPFGTAVGARDGAYAARIAPTLGAPPGTIIQYTADFDPNATETQQVMAAFRAFKAALMARYLVGCYGSGALCDLLWEQHVIASRWITMSGGFRGSRVAVQAGRYEFHQLLPTITGGVSTDPDVMKVSALSPAAKDASVGLFTPFAHIIPTKPVAGKPVVVAAKPPVAPSSDAGGESTDDGKPDPVPVADPKVEGWFDTLLHWKPETFW